MQGELHSNRAHFEKLLKPSTVVEVRFMTGPQMHRI